MARTPWASLGLLAFPLLTIQDWPLWAKIIILVNISFYNFMGNMYSAGASPLISMVIADLHCTQQQASVLPTYVLLGLGISNIFAIPSARLFGKRFAIVGSMIVFLASSIWAGEAKSYDSLLAARMVGGFAGGIAEAIGPSIVAETFKEHQLARAMVVYICLLASGSCVGPAISGAIATTMGTWRWFHRLSSIMIGINLISCILMFPETRHDGDGLGGPQAIQTDSHDHATAEDPTSSPADEKEVVEHLEQERDMHPEEKTFRQMYHERSWTGQYCNLTDGRRALFDFVLPFRVLLTPIVPITGLVFGVTIGWTVLVSILAGILYPQPPMLWTSTKIGNLFMGSFVGILVGIPAGGVLADWLYVRAVRRGKEGDPRIRLPVVILGAAVSPTGCLLIGDGFKHITRWAEMVVGWGMLSFGLTASANVLITYAVDCYPPRAADIGVVVNLLKNSIAFGVTYSAISWYSTTGPFNQFAGMAGILWAMYLLVIPVYFFHDTIIRKTQWLVDRKAPAPVTSGA